MKIIHMECGLGNQMACYAVYEAVRYSHPDEEIYVETYSFDVKEAYYSGFRSYDLKRIFNIDIPDLRTLFTEEQNQEIIDKLRESKFWENGWMRYAELFIGIMKGFGYEIKNAYSKVGDVSTKKNPVKRVIKKAFRTFGSGTANSAVSYKIKKIMHSLNRKLSGDCGIYLLDKREGDFFYDITLDFMKSPYLINQIGDNVRQGLQFRKVTDENNRKYMEQILSCNSVSVHVRRTDYLTYVDDCYKYNFFKKCVNYIRTKVEAPVFFIFSDDMDWCKNNYMELGLDNNDEIVYVEGNIGEESYRDMQLMASCKHNIFTKSSFGWWGGFLNKNPHKITCCQVSQYISTNQF